ncbi:hypothetical protein FDUTEX481_09941 [Tolypothrix sp. PCC 7601]|nr:hypothetical protein FDUTEX481_09941 [Tolypothrix sp. PCC 7601]
MGTRPPHWLTFYFCLIVLVLTEVILNLKSKIQNLKLPRSTVFS